MRCSTAQHPLLFGVVRGLLVVILLSMAGAAALGEEYSQIREEYFGRRVGLAQVEGDPTHIAELSDYGEIDPQLEAESEAAPQIEQEARGTPRFDSSAALEAAARLVVQELHAASAALPSMLSEEARAGLRALMSPAAVTESLGASRRGGGESERSPVLEFSYERIAVLHDLQSRLQRIVFAEHIGVSVEQYRAVALQVSMYLGAEAAAAARVQGTSAGELTELELETETEMEFALAVLASPVFRRAMAAADQGSAEVERFRAGLEQLYKQLDAAVASADLSEHGYLRPRVETLRPSIAGGRLAAARLPFRRSVAVSAVPSAPGTPGSGTARRLLPHEIAAQLYYERFVALTNGESENPELWGRLHGQHVRPEPPADMGLLSLQERFAAEMEPELRLLSAFGAQPPANSDREAGEHAERAALAVELVDSLLHAADRYIERPMSGLSMSPELYLGREYRRLGPHTEPELMYHVLLNAVGELEQDILKERRSMRLAAEELRNRAADNEAQGDTP